MSLLLIGLAVLQGVAARFVSGPCVDGAIGDKCETLPHHRTSSIESSLLQHKSDFQRIATDGQDFTVVIVPDTQFMVMDNGYSGAWLFEWIAQADWIVEHQHVLNIAAVIHVGDVVEEAHRSWEWDNFFQGWTKIEATGIPWSIVPGNHDLTSMAQPFAWNRWDDYNRYLTPVFQRNAHLAGNFPSGKYENSVVFFEASGIEFMVVGIELGPTQESLDWASSQLNQYPSKRAIINNHFVVWGAERGINIAAWAKRHRNIFMIHQGHDCAREWNKVIYNDWGEPIHEVLTDYQCSGDAYLRYYTFRVASNRVDAFTYSPSLSRFETDANSQWSFDFTMSSLPSGSWPAPEANRNVYQRVTGVGGYGGWCTCPDGNRYNVGDYNDGCGLGPDSLACDGGVPEECVKQHDNSRFGMKVTCAASESTPASGTEQPTPLPPPSTKSPSSSPTTTVESDEHFYREVSGVGGWGGWCTCPDGQSFNVGDNNDACAKGPESLACEGGTPGECVKVYDSTRKGMKVTCSTPALPLCSAEFSQHDKWDCPTDKLGVEQLIDPTFLVDSSWTSYTFHAADASFDYRMPGVVVSTDRDHDSTAWHVQLMQDVELDRSGGAQYALCVQAGGAALGAVLQFSVDGGDALNYAIAGGGSASRMEVPAGSLRTECFRFTLTDSSQRYVGRVALEFGAGEGDAVVCAASLRRCAN